jgi:hypothetical protein
MRHITATGQQGLWVVALPLPTRPWDHPLNCVNWYAVARYLREPGLSPAKVKMDWARATYGEAGTGAVVQVLDDVTAAARGTLEFDALFGAAHSRFPTLPYLDSHLCGPLRRAARMKGMMGLALPLDMYPPEIAAQIRAEPRTRLVFNQAPVDAQLEGEALAQKDAAVGRMRSAIAAWHGLEGKIDPRQYAEVLAGLKGNLNDAIIFRRMMELYFGWKLGKLTEGRIDAALEACRGLQGRIVPDPLDPHPAPVTVVEPASFRTFAEELRQELRHPGLEEYWRRNPDPHVTYLIPPSK